MKRGYRNLLIFELIIFLLLILNTFTKNYLYGYKFSIFLIVILIIFKLLFGFEKDRHRYIRDFILDETIFLTLFLIFYYLFGVLVGFSKANYWNINGFTKFIIPTALYVILREFFRNMALCKSEGSKLLIVTTIILLIFMDVTETVYFISLTSGHNMFLFIAVTLLPAIFNNVAFSYITHKIGYKPVIYYCLIVELYGFLIPIVPNPDQYLSAIISIVLPSYYGYRSYNFFEKTKDHQIERNYHKNKHYLKALIPLVILTGVMIYYVSGLFSHWAVVVASGSMTGTINKGDIVIINKIKSDYEKLEVGDVIAYKYNNKIIVHRIVEKIKVKDEFYFKTKGDANKDVDNFIVSTNMIVGKVDAKIPYLGLPTVWLNG